MYSGIDISKDSFDLAVIQEDNFSFHQQFENNQDGFTQCLQYIKDSDLVVMEATGSYHFKLALFLYRNGVAVSVVNPMVIKRFSQMQMQRAKTDKKDALLIAEYGKIHKPDLWYAPDEVIRKIRHIATYLDGLKTRRRMAKNQLHAFRQDCDTQELINDINQEINELDQRIEKQEKKINKLIRDTYNKLYNNLVSIPGIGPKSAIIMIIHTNGFKNFDNYKQVISYFGLAPRIIQSGKSVKPRAKICKMGMGLVRSTLYMAAGSARTCNKKCRELYERLISKGKNHNLALIAVANKLIKQAFAIAKSGNSYNPDFVK